MASAASALDTLRLVAARHRAALEETYLLEDDKALQVALRIRTQRLTVAANATHFYVGLPSPKVAIRVGIGRADTPESAELVGAVGTVPLYLDDPGWEAARPLNDATRRWLEQPANTTLLEQLRFVEGDWLLLGANHTLATFGATDAKRDERRIDLLVQIVEAATDPSARWLRQERLSARALPQAFRDLAPLIRAWGIDDDLIRGERMSRARTSTLESLWSAVGARLPAIDALLDEPGSDASYELLRLGRLAEATAEARIELDRRAGLQRGLGASRHG